MLLEMYVRVKNRMAELNDERGISAIEYALLIVLVAMGITVAMTGLATKISTAIGSIVFG